MKFRRFTSPVVGFVAVGGVAWGCSGQSTNCSANEDCGAFAGPGGGGLASAGTSGDSAGGGKSGASGASGTGGVGGKSAASGASGTSSAGEAGSSGAPPAVCDPTSSPDADSCVIGDDYGIFVSSEGSDDATKGDGTEAKPFATVTKALTVTGLGKINRIYVCAGEYTEPGTLTIADRVSIYGGFSCDNGSWAYTTTSKAQLESASPLAASIDTASHGVTLQDVRIDAADAPADGTGASSFGLLINASKGVVLTRVEIHAGKGGGGKAGTDGAAGADGAVAGQAQNGSDASCAVNATVPNTGATPVPQVCGSQGGNGGSGQKVATYEGPQDGSSGIPSTNIVSSPNQNGGKGEFGTATPGVTTPAAAGTAGSSGLPGTPGVAAIGVGPFSPGGYVPASGGSGTAGFPGQGGGGGGASLGSATCVGAAGGAGGMGGCGGDFGAGGTGGGASIALLSWNSAVSINGCALVANTGGAGGPGGNAHVGGLGKPGGTGGNPDVNHVIADAGGGGKGGNGGNGGNGAGGTGGPSIALVYAGTRPDDSMTPATLIVGTGGALGVGGKVGGTSALQPGFDGQPGKSAFEYKAD